MFFPDFFAALPRVFANDSPRAVVQNVGLLFAGVVLTFAIWQFREQLDRVKRPEARFFGRSTRDFKFLKRQAFRRLQLSGLAGVAGVLMLVGLYLPPDWSPLLWTSAWFGVAFFVGWSTLLAGVDAVSIWLHFASAGRRQSVEKILLEYKLRQMCKKNGGSESENASTENGENRETPETRETRFCSDDETSESGESVPAPDGRNESNKAGK